MLMEADLPDDVEALRALALKQSRRLADVTLAKGEAENAHCRKHCDSAVVAR